MARFRLKGKHYLKVPGTEWEQKETSQETGKQARKVYPVPRFLDPDDPGDWNFRDIPEITVSTKEDPKYPRDIIFIGKPTPDMEPLDDEAVAMFKRFEADWTHPIESLSPIYGENILAGLQLQVAALQSKTGAPAVDVVAELKKQIAELTVQVSNLTAARRRVA